MGYKRQARVYKLVFEDDEFEGLEVRAKSPNVKGLMKFVRLLDSMTGDDPKLTQVDEVFSGFAGYLVSWNLEGEDGTPVPATLEGLEEQDTPLVMAIVKAWVEGISGVDPTSGNGSPPGGTPPEESLGLAASSSVLPSS